MLYALKLQNCQKKNHTLLHNVKQPPPLSPPHHSIHPPDTPDEKKTLDMLINPLNPN